MNFSEFLAGSIQSLTEASKYRDLHTKTVYAGDNYKLGEVYAMDDDAVEFDSYNEVNFNLYPVLDKGEDKDLTEVIFIEVSAEYDVDHAHQSATRDDPEDIIFDLDKSSAKYKFELFIDKHADEETYPGLAAATSRLKDAFKNKDKLEAAASKALDDLFDAHNDIIYDLYKKEGDRRSEY